MSKQWHKGPPPSVGWWPASYHRDDTDLRWWDGTVWSFRAHEGSSKRWLRDVVKCVAEPQDGIEWTDRPASWPERSKT